MATLNVHLEGAEELRAKLEAMDRELRGKTLARATLKAAELLVPEIEANVRSKTRVRSGHLSEGWGAETVEIGQYHATSAAGTTKDEDPFYWRFLELGTEKIRKRPMARPAFDEHKDDMRATVGDIVRKVVEEVARS